MARQKRSFLQIIDDRTHRARVDVAGMSTAKKVGAGFAAAAAITGTAWLVGNAISGPSAPAQQQPAGGEPPRDAASARPAPAPQAGFEGLPGREDVARAVLAHLLVDAGELGELRADPRITIDGVGISDGTALLWTTKALKNSDRTTTLDRAALVQLELARNTQVDGIHLISNMPTYASYFVGLRDGQFDCVYAAPNRPLDELVLRANLLEHVRSAKAAHVGVDFVTGADARHARNIQLALRIHTFCRLVWGSSVNKRDTRCADGTVVETTWIYATGNTNHFRWKINELQGTANVIQASASVPFSFSATG
jgi:hypothetical protein